MGGGGGGGTYEEAVWGSISGEELVGVRVTPQPHPYSQDHGARQLGRADTTCRQYEPHSIIPTTALFTTGF